MKLKKQLIFLVLGVILLALSGFLFTHSVNPAGSESQTVVIPDWIYASGGNLDVTVTYPKTIETGQKNLITVSYQADSALESVLANGVVFDAQLDMLKSVIQPQKRLLIPVEKGRQTFTWEVEPFTAGVADAIVSMALVDNSVSGNYAITSQQKLQLNMEIGESSAQTKSNLTTIGFVSLGAGLVSLLAAYLINKHAKAPAKARR